MRSVFVAVMVSAIVVSGRPINAQFGKGVLKKKTEVVLSRKRPPEVYLMGVAIKVDATAQTSEHGPAAARLGSMLEAQLTSNDPRLKPVKDQPETLITCTLGVLESSRTQESRQVTVSKKTGTRTVYNDKTKKNEVKDVYSDVRETHSYVIVQGNATTVLSVKDVKTGEVLDSGTFNQTYPRREFRDGLGAPDAAMVEQQLITMTVAVIVPRLTPTREALEILLARPNDEIDDINEFGKSGLWTRMLERLELTRPLADPKKEPYRLYNLGVANEALAYAAEDLVTSRKLLDLASSYYGKSIDGKPDEEYFRGPQTRIAEAIAAYSKIDSQVAAYSRALASAATLKEAVAATAATAATEATSRSLSSATPIAFTNNDVIEQVKAGLDLPNVLASINEAKIVEFNFATEGLKNLLANKVPNSVITAMRAKQSAAEKPTPAPTRKPTTRKPAPVGTKAPAPPFEPATTAPAGPAVAQSLVGH